MLFAHDTEVALAAAAALVNTVDVLDPDRREAARRRRPGRVRPHLGLDRASSRGDEAELARSASCGHGCGRSG